MVQRPRFFAALLLWGALPIGAALAVEPTEPVASKPDAHRLLDLAGWTVAVDCRLLDGEQASLGAEAQQLLVGQLQRVKLVLPEQRVVRLQRVRLWLDLEHGALRSPQYHPNVEWLVDHGYSPQLARCVHFPDARYLTAAQFQLQQPWAVMHELAHAYHDQALGFDDAEIADLWRRVKASGRFDRVLHVDGERRPHYALANPMEFFAEMSESYLGQNDFYPFVRAELQRDEPETYALLERVWRTAAAGPPGEEPSAAAETSAADASSDAGDVP